MALGANAAAIGRIVMTTGLLPALAGVILGLAGSIALSRTIRTFLYETSALDPVIYAAVPVVLLAAPVVACLAPAARASRFDPVQALRSV